MAVLIEVAAAGFGAAGVYALRHGAAHANPRELPEVARQTG
jgi:hypothetical protein